jgi:Domain of unknown function (DUF3806)
MSQLVEALNEKDIDHIARQLIHASGLVEEISGAGLSGDLSDLALLQKVLDTNVIEREATYSLQALGMAFGKVFVNNNEGYDWWMVEDEYGRDPAARYRDTSLLVFPQTMISKRVEDGEEVAVVELYEGLKDHLQRILAENYPNA